MSVLYAILQTDVLFFALGEALFHAAFGLAIGLVLGTELFFIDGKNVLDSRRGFFWNRVSTGVERE